MKIIVLGKDISGLLAMYSAYMQDNGVGLAMFTPYHDFGGRPLILRPTLNELIPAAVPSLGRLAQMREIRLVPSGSAENWPDKVGRPDKTPERFPAEPETFFAYPADEAFHHLLELLGNRIYAGDFTSAGLDAIVDQMTPDLLINTMPMGDLCRRPDDHGFTRRQFWTSSRIGPSIDDDTIMLNSEDAPAWYCSSKIGGSLVTKWLIKPPFSDMVDTSLPQFTNCDCAPHGMIHVGAEATFNPLATLLDVYSDTAAAVMRTKEGQRS